MTMQSVPISSDGPDPTMDIDTKDVSSVDTPPFGYRNSEEDQSFVSKRIRFYFAPYDHSRIDRIHPSEVHAQWIRIIQSAYGDDIKIINNSKIESGAADRCGLLCRDLRNHLFRNRLDFVSCRRDQCWLH